MMKRSYSTDKLVCVTYSHYC